MFMLLIDFQVRGLAKEVVGESMSVRLGIDIASMRSNCARIGTPIITGAAAVQGGRCIFGLSFFGCGAGKMDDACEATMLQMTHFATNSACGHRRVLTRRRIRNKNEKSIGRRATRAGLCVVAPRMESYSRRCCGIVP